MEIKQLNTGFVPPEINSNDVTKLLLTKEKSIGIISQRTEVDFYNNFYSSFGTYLQKLPNNNVNKYVSHLYNLKGIYLGIGRVNSNNELVFSRLLIAKDKLAGIVLNSEYFEVDLATGNTPNVDTSIYASYFGLIRAAILCNKQDVLQDNKLHKLLITYLYQIILKLIVTNMTLIDRQLNGLLLGCAYLYVKHFLQKTHLQSLNLIKKIYKDVVSEEVMQLYINKLDIKSSKYISIKQIGNVLLDLDIIISNPNQIIIQILNSFGSAAFYNFIGSFDHFIALIIINNYPNNLYNKVNIFAANQQQIEKYVCSTYLDETGYSILKK